MEEEKFLGKKGNITYVSNAYLADILTIWTKHWKKPPSYKDL